MIEYHRYILRSRGASALNARSERREFEGALIRIDGLGVGCIHPWPELGDASLDEELAALVDGSPLPLATCALECAAVDGAARGKGIWLFEDRQIPRSHWTAGFGDDPETVAAEGFDAVKLKVGPDLEATLSLIDQWGSVGKMQRLRLDFNESLDAKTYIEIWQRLSAPMRAKVEFVEDPFPYDFDPWTAVEAETGVALALDRQAGDFGEQWTGVVVVKPATVPNLKIRTLAGERSRPLVFTSYMDHAVGQCWAACVAATHRAGGNTLAGLLTHERFEADDFFSALRRDGSVLLPPPGTGLGFDQQLNALPWKPLT